MPPFLNSEHYLPDYLPDLHLSGRAVRELQWARHQERATAGRVGALRSLQALDPLQTIKP